MFSFITISTEPRNFLLLDAVPRRVILVENGCKLRIDFISLCQAQIILYYWKSPTGKNRTGKIYQIGKLAPTASFSGEFRKMRAAVDLCRRSLSRSVWRSGRFYCTEQSSRVKIFDRDLKRKQRDRAAWLLRSDDSLVDAVAENLLDRLEDCTKTFPSALCMGGSMAAIRRLLKGRGGIEKLLMMDASVDMVKLCQQAEQNVTDKNVETSFVVGDEEFLPVKESSMDLVISCLGLHWTNDLLGAMIQSRLALKPDGLFLGAILGGETLRELRIACTVAQMEREGGISPRLSPLAQVRDAGNLLTRAGFTLPGVDVDEYTVRYNSALELIEHLRTMGETNALFQRSQSLKRDTALATAAIYESMFGAEDGTIPATFQVIFMTGWREHPSQQQAKKRGSATVSFKDIHKQFGEAGSVWKMHHWNEQRKVRAFYDMLDRGEISVIAAEE